MRLRVVISEAVRSIAANLSTTFAAILTVLIAMFILGLAIGLGTWTLSWSNHVKKELLVKVFFCTPSAPGCTGDATTAQIDAVRERLLAMDEVKSIRFISKEDALKIMQKRSPELTRDLPGNPLPASYEVTPEKGEFVETIAKRLEPGAPGVHKVDYGKKTAQRVLRVARVFEVVFLAAVLLLLVASTLLIANTIRLSIFSRRREIEVMKLVGATNWFVRGPFMLEGLICGLAGSAIAVLLLLIGKEVALPAILGHFDTASDVRALGFGLNALILLGAGLFIGAFGSGLTLHRFLRV
ncbi:MAG: ABC transporter permease [Actinobacteria bacterium]|nr:ABC transporter permease [Actinomycetota bacterium]